jgi:hypothetical protein
MPSRNKPSKSEPNYKVLKCEYGIVPSCPQIKLHLATAHRDEVNRERSSSNSFVTLFKVLPPFASFCVGMWLCHSAVGRIKKTFFLRKANPIQNRI